MGHGLGACRQICELRRDATAPHSHHARQQEGRRASRQLSRTLWFAWYWGPVRRESAVDGRTVIEELTAVNRTLAERSGDTAIYNTAVASVGGELPVAWTHGERPAELHLMK